MEEFKTILLSVFSGVITALVIYLVSVFIKKIFLPWYQRFIYKGVDISGIWEGNHTRTENVSIAVTLDLKQSAHDIIGTLTIIKIVDDAQKRVTSMSVIGEVWEGFVSLQCRTISNKNLSFGSMLCKIIDSSLQGKYVFRNLAGDGSDISNLNINLNRKNS